MSVSPNTAIVVQGLFGLSYVSSLYLLPNGRVPDTSSVGLHEGRNDPKVIKARLTAATLSTGLCCFGLWSLVTWSTNEGYISTGRRAATLLGLTPSSLSHIFAHLPVPVLFLGPLFELYMSSSLPFQRRWSFQRDVLSIFTTWQGLRNFVIAPITEELVFRACIISVAIMAGVSHTKIIFLTPLWFGLAHVHHVWGQYTAGGRTRSALVRGIIISLVQLTYTTIFGWYTSFLFLRTSSIYPPISSHIFCNIMGLPSPGDSLRRYPKQKTLIWSTYLLGIVGFILVLGPWTR